MAISSTTRATESGSAVTIFGIRHHGPGSARSLVRSLQTLQPDIILVEGPPEANDSIPLIAHSDMKPPVALLIYAPDHIEQAAYYPFAIFSPEWQALQYALKQDTPARFIDLPQAHRIAARAERVTEPAEEKEPPQFRADPLSLLASAAGYTDSERWWEHLVEQRRDSTDLFAAILEAMSAVRQDIEQERPPDLSQPYDLREAQREAYMRRTIRQAEKEGFQKIAVVCGAWHGPALCKPFPAQKEDNSLLKGLPKVKVKATWIPWTYGRLSNQTGYGAGIASPGWYDHLWKASHRQKSSQKSTTQTTIQWLTKVARLLRREDLEASSASVIEAVRLAEALAAMRDAAMPGLEELNEAVQTVLCFGDDAPLRLVHEKLIVSDRLGQVPAETPLIPLQQDLQRLQKRLRLKPEALEKLVTMDLRKPLELERSHLLHRLQLLRISWGIPQRTSGKGTFKEAWQLCWQPELNLAVIEAGRWGNTVESAAETYAKQKAEDAADSLQTLTKLLDQVLLASLSEAIAHIMQRLENAAAITNDVTHLMSALPPLANILRYRDVRQTDSTVVAKVVDGLVARICIGLPGACASLDDKAAAQLLESIEKTHGAVKLLQQETHEKAWSAVLLQLCDREGLHGLIAGRCCRLLLDGGNLQGKEAATRLGLALSLANEPVQAAAWVDGFLQGSGLLLLHDDVIWQVLDRWITDLSPDTFTALLPLIRRTFSIFSPAERRQMGNRVLNQQPTQTIETDTTFDQARADTCLPLIAQLLGLPSSL